VVPFVAKTGLSIPRVNIAVLGNGTSASAVLKHVSYLPLSWSSRKNWDTNLAIIGGTDDVWSKFPGNFSMGQSGSFFKSDVRDHTSADAAQFMKVRDYTAELARSLRNQPAVVVQGKAARVRKYGTNDFLIVTSDGTEIGANHVIVATGAGPERGASSFVSLRNQPAKPRRPFPEVINGTDFMMSGLCGKGGVVAVYGGAPTSSWDAGVAMLNGNQVVWIASPDHGGFASANPNGRNSEIIRRNKNNMFLGTPEEVIYRDIGEPYNMQKGGIVLRLRDLRHDGDRSGKDTELVVSQFVYAVGTDPNEALSFLDPWTYSGLVPIYDKMACFSANPLDTALGLTTEDGDLVVVGPAAYKGLTAKGSGMLWENMAKSLPPPAQPYAGIAMINCSVEALANYMALDNLNLYIANRRQIAEKLSDISHLATESNRLEVADKVIEARSKSGVTEAELIKLIKEGLGTGTAYL
jgi:hypothetical protein